MFFASSTIKRHQKCCAISLTPYHYATLTVGHLPPGYNQGGKWPEGGVWLGAGCCTIE